VQAGSKLIRRHPTLNPYLCKPEQGYRRNVIGPELNLGLFCDHPENDSLYGEASTIRIGVPAVGGCGDF